MKLRPQPPLHLTYCLNVHPGDTWEDNFSAIRSHTLRIRERVAPGKPFGLGLRLARNAATALLEPGVLAEFQSFMEHHQLYAFTINGFPYGTFHGRAVKTNVYRPDWSSHERLDYTLALAEILGRLLPEGTDGSISTVPLGYRVDGYHTHPTPAMITHLAECAVGFHHIRNRTGREIHLGLEPEPDCILETTDEVITFFERHLLEHATHHIASRLACAKQEAEVILRRHVGVCFDTCHLALQFESLPDSMDRLIRHGIRLSKVQLSSALEVTPDKTARQRLTEFLDPVYLHQVKAAPPATRHFADLADALDSPDSCAENTGSWRIHFHLPLYFEGDGVLRSTTHTLDARFWKALASAPVTHLEMETYTFHVLPAGMQSGGVEASVAREYDWTRARWLTSRP